MDDPFNLERFVRAQDPVFDDVLAELARGRKQSHWMWFAFPQLKGLGSSAMAEKFGLASRGEAEAYLAHPVLGPRLRECTELVSLVDGRSCEQIFGSIDSVKFRSSMTLFAEVAGDGGLFVEVLRKYFAGRGDALTIERL